MLASDDGVRLVDVGFAYGDGPPLFEHLNLSVPPGTSLALMAPSGAGKSSLLKAISGLVPVTGTIEVGGEVVTGMSSRRRESHRLRMMGQVFQDAELLPELNACENAGLPGRLLGLPKAEYEARARRDLVRFGLAGHELSWPEELSGGQRQRVALARALNNDPYLVLADEPTGALDERNAQLVAGFLADLARERNCCVIVATHDNDVAARCDEVYSLRVPEASHGHR